MDRGAARSRKRANKASQPATVTAPAPSAAAPGPSKDGDAHDAKAKPKGRPERPKKPERQEQSRDPSLYRPKAIRTSAALIYSQEAFPIPPPAEMLANVRRVDLGESGATDVSWLDGTGVTWLSLAGCKIEEGWEAVGSLQELSVLNISGCGLKKLPESLKKLSKLKAIVAMNNEWTELDPDVLASWPELNSLIVSHSPNLVSLPSTLSSLHHLAKLTFSHCPRLTASSLPDLSPLPLLRDVKMNNLPALTSLPPHISLWGKGNMSLVGKGKDESTPQLGDGLQTLDLGNCSLSFQAISGLFGLAPTAGKRRPTWAHLRSLSLHSNPIASTHPKYAELLQASPDLPDLQIIDAKRVVERKRKGMVSETKGDKRARERKEGKMKPSGANVGGTKMRTWGKEKEKEDGGSDGEAGSAGEGDADEGDKPAAKKQKKDKAGKGEEKERKEKREKNERKPETVSKKRKHGEPVAEAEAEAAHKRKKRTHSKAVPTAAPSTPAPAAVPAPPVTDPTDALRAPAPEAPSRSRMPDRSGKNQAAVVGVVEVGKDGEEAEMSASKRKRNQAKAKKGLPLTKGLDLREVFGKDKAKDGEGQSEDTGTGLGVGGW
ncbi:hypothetical protein IAT38_008222 [Cryptococcus sp. DSM 104549]